jgi:tRNA pseudouridine55 synthase
MDSKYSLNNLHGWLFIDKPVGISSFGVVHRLKKHLKIPKNHKIGHGGTLDPMAEGVLPIAIGEATKTVEFVMNSDKIYEFTIQFCEKTNTKDLEGEVLETTSFLPNEADLLKKFDDFKGEIYQIPPSFSAIKINGKRAYELAREGFEFEIPKRKVNIYSLELKTFDKIKKQATLVAKVSKGTYIRTLAEDIAESLGSLGHTIYLRRTEICIHKEKLLLSLNTIYNEAYTCYNNLISIEDMLDDILAYSLTLSEARLIRNGNLSGLTSTPKGIFKVTFDGKVLALLEQIDGKLKFLRVFNNANI